MDQDIYYSGSLEAALQDSQQSKKLVTVIVQDGSDHTIKLHEDTLENAEIKQLLANTSLTLLLDDDSEAGVSFKKTYSPSSIPCVYILMNGFPVATMTGYVGPDELKTKLETSFQAIQQFAPQKQELEPQQPSAEQPLTPEEIEAHKQRIKEKLKQLRDKKSKQEEQDELEREKRRREDGKKMIETQQKLKELKEQREREIEAKKKEQDRLYQEQLREQIRLEKLERQKRTESSSASSAATPSTQPTSPASQKREAQSSSSSSSCMIRVRLFSGELASQSFSATEKLSAVRDWIQSLTFKSKFVMSTNYPARVFKPADMNSTLAALNLVPSANIILSETDPSNAIATSSPAAASSSQSSSGGWLSSTWSSVSGFVWNFLSAPSINNSSQASPDSNQSSQPSSPSVTPNRTTTTTGAARVSGSGNIHSLSTSSTPSPPSTGDGKKKDEYFWNGNSTQFGN